MARKLVTVTDDAQLQPTVSTSLGFRFVRALVAEQVGPEAAAMLCEPQPVGDEGKRQWMTDGALSAPSLRLKDAPAETAATARDLVTAAREAAADAYARLSRSPEEGRRQQGAVVLRSFEVPQDEENIWIVEGRPVLVAWGHVAASASFPSLTELEVKFQRRRPPPAPPSVLEGVSGPAAGSSGPPAEPVGDERPRGRSAAWLAPLLWLVFAALASVVGVLLFLNCAVHVPGTSVTLSFPGSCRTAAAAGPTDLADRHAALLDAIQHAQLDLAGRPPCPTPPPPPEPPRPPPEPPRQEPPPQSDACVAAGCQTGRLQITLLWPTQADLDLHVRCPGHEISFAGKRGCGDGLLDVDAQSERDFPRPVENVRWTLPPPAGRYAVDVVLYSFKGTPERPIDYEIQVRLNDEFRSCRGRISRQGEKQTVIAFTLPGRLPDCARR